MTIHFTQWTLDVHDPDLMAGFWSQALGYRVDPHPDGSVKLYPTTDASTEALVVWLQPTEHPKRDKNRNHPDLNADGDVETEVERLLELGASRVDVGQADDDPFVVLADPEGNEFCVLRRYP